VKIGLGLPIGDPETLLTWAKLADEGPFSTLGLLDRVVHHNPEPMVALAAVAGATTRIRLQTEVLVAPLREPLLLAKQVATLDRMSRGRFTLGLGVGGNEQDFAALGVDLRTRGRRLDEQLTLIRQTWKENRIGPTPTHAAGPEILFGAWRGAALRRIAHFGDGLLCAAPPSYAGDIFRTVEAAWAAHGREGSPRFVAQCNVALGPQATKEQAKVALASYYGSNPYVDQILAGLPTTREAVQQTIDAYADLGVDELMLYCWSGDTAQVERLAELVR
jgi:alkanesulfonate monooxygenase SsuD/methylene tetrahydromethanopterin reductase-like flavin-dependent oxidoreductase (luciferase family)